MPPSIQAARDDSEPQPVERQHGDPFVYIRIGSGIQYDRRGQPLAQLTPELLHAANILAMYTRSGLDLERDDLPVISFQNQVDLVAGAGTEMAGDDWRIPPTDL